MADMHEPAVPQADAAMSDDAPPASARSASKPTNGKRPGRGYNGSWNSQADKMLQSAVLAARLGGGGEVKVKYGGGEVEVTISVKHRADSEPELVAQTRQLRLQGVVAQQQRLEEAIAAAEAARAARTAKNRRDKERKKEKRRQQREQQQHASMQEDSELSDDQQLTAAVTLVVAGIKRDVDAAQLLAPRACAVSFELEITGNTLVVPALAGTDGQTWSGSTVSKRVLHVARAGLASREQGEAAYDEMIKEYLSSPPNTSAKAYPSFRVPRPPQAGDGG